MTPDTADPPGAVAESVDGYEPEAGADARVFRHERVPTVEFGFGTRTAHGTDEHATTEALVRNAISHGTRPFLYGGLTSTDG